MNVILVSHGFQSNYERGFANAVSTLGVDTTLITSDRSDAAGLTDRVRAVNLRGSQEERRPRWAKAWNQMRYLGRLLPHIASRPRSAVHVIGLIEPPLLMGVALGLAFRGVARRYVLTVHNLLPHDRHTKWQRLWFGLAFRLPQVLVVHTELMGRRLVDEFGVAPGRIVHMEHGLEPVDTPLPQTRGDSVEAGPLKLLFFGVLKHYKGLDVLLDALSDAGFPFELEIHGICTSESLAGDIARRIQTHPAGRCIRWNRNFVPETEVPRLMLEADALVLPYRTIDQSGVLFQALRFGLPIVATRVGSFDSYVPPEVGELCDPDDVTSLRMALRRLASRRAQLHRDQIREQGRRYEWPVTVRALEGVYAD